MLLVRKLVEISSLKLAYTLETEIPVNTQAQVSVNLLSFSSPIISESGQAVWQSGQYVSGTPGITAAQV